MPPICYCDRNCLTPIPRWANRPKAVCFFLLLNAGVLLVCSKQARCDARLSGGSMSSDNNAGSQEQSATPAPQPALAPPTARSVLVDWANGEEGWLRSIVAEVIKTRAEIADQRVKYFYHQFLRERKLENAAPDPVGLLLADLGSTAQGKPNLTEPGF